VRQDKFLVSRTLGLRAHRSSGISFAVACSRSEVSVRRRTRASNPFGETCHDRKCVIFCFGCYRPARVDRMGVVLPLMTSRRSLAWDRLAAREQAKLT
jgi:hypothetical protein